MAKDESDEGTVHLYHTCDSIGYAIRHGQSNGYCRGSWSPYTVYDRHVSPAGCTGKARARLAAEAAHLRAFM
jgi:hypothetical protein